MSSIQNNSTILTTEQESIHHNLEKKSVVELVKEINEEDQKVAKAIELALPQIEALVAVVAEKLQSGGRLFYIGAGTSGRLGILDASECPPTYGVPEDMVIGIIAGGNKAITAAVEGAEDDVEQGWRDLTVYQVGSEDIVVGLAASGGTPYVLGAMTYCRENNITTGCITCNKHSALAQAVNFPVEVIVGPEFVTGSTRMKSGTAQKMVLNMISTVSMIKLGRVQDNKMINMQLSNDKLIDRGTRMIMQQLHILDYEEARSLLLQYGSVKRVWDSRNMA